MSKYTIAPRARQDLLAIWNHIALENDRPLAADAQLDRLCEAFRMLASQPLLGQARDDLRPGVRVFAADCYAIVYLLAAGGVQIVAVVHGARDIDSLFHDAGG
jgi:toxin ParE1/3/4